MSMDSGDFNNDQKTDLYVAQIAGVPTGSGKIHTSNRVEICNDQSTTPEEKAGCFQKERERTTAANKPIGRFQRCDQIEFTPYRTSCATLGIIAAAVKNKTPDLCSSVPASWPSSVRICDLATAPRIEQAKRKMEEKHYLDAVNGRNVLLEGAGTSFKDIAPTSGTGNPGWSWNAKFTDLDQDGFQDIFVATGEHFGSAADPNSYFSNLAGKGFEERATEMGLSDLVPTTSYVLIDYDRDGDIDIIRAPGMGPPIVHRNERPKGKAVWIRLHDELGNRSGIGAKIEILAASPSTNSQIRELKSSGGFNSFDAPKVHFGLGDAESISQIIVTWRDGAVTKLDGPVKGDTEIVITRQQ